MACPICEKRKAKRFCPAKAQTICSVCCGTEREVSIDCPSDCPYLRASRQYDYERKEIDWSKLPFPDTKLETSFVVGHKRLIDTLALAICPFAVENRSIVDSDVVGALQALAETYQTLSRGIYYEKPPESLSQRQVYEALKVGVEEFRREEARKTGLGSTRDAEIRDTLIFLSQLGAARSNGRPKGRAYLDLLRSQFKPEAFPSSSSNLLVLP